MNDLAVAAGAAREHAYAPYSRFRVGAAVRGAGGGVYAACNVENAAYPVGTCAEAGAIAAMVAAGERRIVEALVLGEGAQPCTPCGACRQRLAEFGSADVPVHVHDPSGHRLTMTLKELLPQSFGLGAASAPAPAPSDPVAVVRSRTTLEPALGIILGSGLGLIADRIEPVAALSFEELPGFPNPTVPGHAGRLILGSYAGVQVACLQGRVHLFEGRPASDVNVLIRTLARLGCRTLIITNAAGSLRPEVGPGSVVLIEDHINFAATNPLVGEIGPTGPSFLDLTEVYDHELRSHLKSVAQRIGLALPTGVYLQALGPVFETPAEIRAFRTLGADLVGMSTVPDAIAARHHKLRVAALSIVTNLAAGLAPAALAHEETLRVAGEAAVRVGDLLSAALPGIASR